MKRSLKQMFGMAIVCAMFATALGVTAVGNDTSSNDLAVSLGDPRDPYQQTVNADPKEPYCVIGGFALGDPREPYTWEKV